MENTANTKSFILTYGLILGALSSIFAFMLYTMDMHYQGGTFVTVVSVVLSTALYALGMFQFRKANDNLMSFGQGLKIGVGIALISGIIAIGMNLLITYVIDPDTLAKSAEFQRETLIENTDLTLEQIDAQLEIMKGFQTPGMIAGIGLLMTVIFGFLLSLIPAAILKKKAEE